MHSSSAWIGVVVALVVALLVIVVVAVVVVVADVVGVLTWQPSNWLLKNASLIMFSVLTVSMQSGVYKPVRNKHSNFEGLVPVVTGNSLYSSISVLSSTAVLGHFPFSTSNTSSGKPLILPHEIVPISIRWA